MLLAAGSALLSQGQAARIVFNGTGTAVNQHPYIVFNPDPNAATNPGAYLVINNSNANAITFSGALTANTPIIKSEAEQNKIRWATATATGSYVIPYSTGGWVTDVAMPLTVQITGAGSGGTSPSLIFSSYNSLGKTTGAPVVNGWNNDNYRPTDVTHMNDMPTGLVNNSGNAIDRFWIIDAGEGTFAYGTRPSVNITFGFNPQETHVNGGNSPALDASTGNLVAQRFNAGLNKWYDILPMGAQAGNTVAGVTPAPADFMRSWTLSNSILPLPIQLLAWEGSCTGNDILLKWTTASEQDNAYFTIEKSRDAQVWSAIGTVPGSGNSSQMISYSFSDDEGSADVAYYRLRQTDINGSSTVGNVIAVGCSRDNGIDIVNAWDDGDYLNLAVSSTMDGVYDLTLMDAQGKIITTRASQVINTGITTLRVDKRGISTGIYMVQLLNSTNMMSRRVHLD
jgi:hypothetical protein